MPINSEHPDYEANIARWRLCRVAYEGEDAVKGAGTEYLPKVDPGQTLDEYHAYRARALFYDAVARTVDGFVGAVSRKAHVIDLPAGMEAFEEDATGEGMGLNEFVKTAVSETLLQARGGILVDYDEVRQRSYLTIYRAEQITSWGDDIRLTETVYEPDPDDALKLRAIDQIRQLSIMDGKYTVTIWRKAQAALGAGEWLPGEPAMPTLRGVPLDAIPWFWLTPKGNTARISKPPLLGMVNVALSHYRTSADLEHGRHFTGLPTLYVTGSTSETAIRVGAASAIVLSDPNARVGYAEFTGQGLKSLETALETKEQQMAALGAAIFSQSKKGVEAAETTRLRTSAENSLLMGVVSGVEESLEAALTVAAEWMGIAPAGLGVAINRDFYDQVMEPAALAALVKAYQAGAISLATFLFNLQQGEMLPPDMDVQKEAARLGADAEAKRQATLAAQNRPAGGESIGDAE